MKTKYAISAKQCQYEKAIKGSIGSSWSITGCHLGWMLHESVKELRVSQLPESLVCISQSPQGLSPIQTLDPYGAMYGYGSLSFSPFTIMLTMRWKHVTYGKQNMLVYLRPAGLQQWNQYLSDAVAYLASHRPIPASYGFLLPRYLKQTERAFETIDSSMKP